MLSDSQVAGTPTNYARLTCARRNPVSADGKSGVSKCRKNLAFLLLIVFYNFARFIKIRFFWGVILFSFHW